jgi:hypothetical protein
MVGNVRDDNRAGGDQGPAADRQAGQNGGVCAQRGTELNHSRSNRPIVGTFRQAIIVDGPGVLVVRKAHMWTDEDAVLDPDSVEYGDVVLDLDPLANLNTLTDIDALADHAVGANPGARLDVGKVPDLGS